MQPDQGFGRQEGVGMQLQLGALGGAVSKGKELQLRHSVKGKSGVQIAAGSLQCGHRPA